MRITARSGIEILNEYYEASEISEYPFLLMPLIPDINKKELRKLIDFSRWIDRATGSIALVLLFWKPLKGTVKNIRIEENIRQKVLVNDVTDAEINALVYGFVYEAAAIAFSLGIPLSDLPCTIVVDGSRTSNFFQVPYKDPNDFKTLTVQLVDYVRKKFPEYSKCREQKNELENRILSNHISKRIWKKVSEHSEMTSILDRTIDQISVRYGEEQHHTIHLIEHIKKHPSDKCAITKLESQLNQLGIPTPFTNLRTTWRHLAEIETYGEPLLDIQAKINIISSELEKLDKPNIEGFLNKIGLLKKTGIIAIKSTNGLVAISSVIDRVAKIAKLLGMFMQ